MATIGGTDVTFADIAKLTDPNGKIGRVIELLLENNPILDDIVMVEGNEHLSNATIVRNSVPTPNWAAFNEGSPITNTSEGQVTDVIGLCEDWSTVDTRFQEAGYDLNRVRLVKDRGHMQGMMNEIAATLFYGNVTTSPKQFHGLMPRYNSTTGTTGDNVILAAASAGAEQTSIWFVEWGDDTCHTLYPKGGVAGLLLQNKGARIVNDASGNPYEQFMTRFRWYMGLAIPHWESVVRIANIDATDLVTYGATVDNSPNLINTLIQATYLLEGQGNKKNTAMYCNTSVATWLDIMAQDKSNVNLTNENFGGRRILMFRGIPIRVCDAILSTEAVVA